MTIPQHDLTALYNAIRALEANATKEPTARVYSNTAAALSGVAVLWLQLFMHSSQEMQLEAAQIVREELEPRIEAWKQAAEEMKA